MHSLSYKGFIIHVFDDPTHRFGSPHNKHQYSKYYFGNSKNLFPVSRHGILIFEKQHLYNSCMLIGFADHTFAPEQSFIMQDDRLMVCCCNMVFCLHIPEMELLWKLEMDEDACYKIQNLENDFLVSGKNRVSRITQYGMLKWQHRIHITNSYIKNVDVNDSTHVIKVKTNTNEEYCLAYNGSSI